jgi:mitogen-activated protein kinase organizer 1
MELSCKRVLKHNGAINSVRFTADGSYCMTASDDRSVKLWNPHRDDPSTLDDIDIKDAFTIKTYTGTHGYGILDVAITMDNSRFASW